MASQSLSAFVIGATGECGKELVKALAKESKFANVTLIGRRQIDLPKEDNPPENYSKFKQELVDFDNLDNSASVFQGYDVGFCALGTTRGKAGKDGFYKVDHDYVVNSAKLAKAGGCKHFNIVSSSGANKNSMIYYSKVKGQTDDELMEMKFERLTIARPGMLLCDRTEQRTTEKMLRTVIGGLDRWRKASVATSDVGRALVSNCLSVAAKPVEILDNAALNQMGK